MKEYGIYKYNDKGFNTYDLDDGTLLYYDGSDGELRFFYKLDGVQENSYCLTLEEIVYVKSWEQHRLDKVLSKFEEDNRETITGFDIFYTYKIGTYSTIEIIYEEIDTQFYLCDNHHNVEEEISLETVESLLKDLEGYNE